jgi:hypothetical protein
MLAFQPANQPLQPKCGAPVASAVLIFGTFMRHIMIVKVLLVLEKHLRRASSYAHNAYECSPACVSSNMVFCFQVQQMPL